MFDELDATSPGGPHLPAHFYIHIPFCRSKCSYCDFASVSDATDEVVEAVTKGIVAQLNRWADASLPGILETVYIGGGTPTHAIGSTCKVLRHAVGTLPLRQGSEITVEANPESLTRGGARELRDAGVTRVSVGVQSFDDTVLRVLGRPHDSRTAARAVSDAIDTGFDVSLDLICGVPGQTMTSWQETLDHALRTGVDHLSVYPLSLEAGTPLSVACDAGLLAEQDGDETADMMMLAEDVLGAAGLIRYEVANYARRGRESRHNVAYWTGRTYAGIGPSAHGMVDPATAESIGLLPPGASGEVSRVRYAEESDIEAWLFGGGQETEVLDEAQVDREDIMLGMRLASGVSADSVREAGLDEVFCRLSRQGLVERVGPARTQGVASARWKTTRRGWLLGNEVFSRIWLAEDE